MYESSWYAWTTPLAATLRPNLWKEFASLVPMVNHHSQRRSKMPAAANATRTSRRIRRFRIPPLAAGTRRGDAKFVWPKCFPLMESIEGDCHQHESEGEQEKGPKNQMA